MPDVLNPTCICGHTRTQHSRGGGCLATVRVPGPVLPSYEPCVDCDTYTVDASLYTSDQMGQIQTAGRDHV